MHADRSFSPRVARAAAADKEAWQGLPARLPEPVRRLAADATIADGELVRRSGADDQDAFAALVARYQKRAFWVAYHVIGRVEDARDVSQEAFVRLYRSLDRYDPARSFYTWFYRIVMNLAIDLLRKRRSAPACSLDDVGPLGESREGDAFLPLQQSDRHALVWQVLDGIDVRFRSVLVMRDIHGLSCREIAPILNITHATARWRLHRGRQLFRVLWDQRFGEEEL